MHAECAFLSVSSGSVWKQAYLSYFVRRNLQSTVQYGFTLLILRGCIGDQPGTLRYRYSLRSPQARDLNNADTRQRHSAYPPTHSAYPLINMSTSCQHVHVHAPT
jgi:hypothetical protein